MPATVHQSKAFLSWIHLDKYASSEGLHARCRARLEKKKEGQTSTEITCSLLRTPAKLVIHSFPSYTLALSHFSTLLVPVPLLKWTPSCLYLSNPTHASKPHQISLVFVHLLTEQLSQLCWHCSRTRASGQAVGKRSFD